MLWRILLFVVLLLIAVRWFLPKRWRELTRRFDRAINVILIALVVGYAVQIVWWVSAGHAGH